MHASRKHSKHPNRNEKLKVISMGRTYSYNPANLAGNTVDRMRLELGDTTFSPGELTAALCDEEYQAIISQHKSWKRAKVKCLEAILMRFAHQVNVSIDGVSYSFSSRVDFWNKLLADAKRENSTGVPTANPLALNGGIGGDSYFYADMQSNHRKCCPSDYRRRG